MDEIIKSAELKNIRYHNFLSAAGELRAGRSACGDRPWLCMRSIIPQLHRYRGRHHHTTDNMYGLKDR